MKISVSIILRGCLGENDKNQNTTSSGGVWVNSAKFSTSDKTELLRMKIFSNDELSVNGVKPMTIKSLASFSDIVLGFKSSSVGSDLKIAFDKAFKIISDKYDNDFNELPSDCRLLWSEWNRKLTSIESHFNKIQDVSKLYAKK